MVFTPESLPNLEGMVYLVTGGNAGIGFHTALQLAAHHAKVYLGTRSKVKGEAAIQQIKNQQPDAEVYLLEMDMTKLRSVVAAAEQEKHLHGLVNNAGVMATPFEKTADGYESQFQINYISHWLLTYHLLPTMIETATDTSPGVVRIVNVASNAHMNVPSFGIDFQDIDQVSGGPVSRYGSSKLANILHTNELVKRYGTPTARSIDNAISVGNHVNGEIWMASLHPGMAKTNLLSGATGSLFVRIAAGLLSALSKTSLIGLSPEKAAYTQLFAVASQDFTRDMNGAYLEPIAQVAKPSKLAENTQLAKDLWEWTENEMKMGGFI
ncbi:hypothetical protein BGW36DRAFT_466456 [Talaromyces proteolyticus]|uniref:NAD(P)-binding protein n=1 Tax=Talaromyces proteolyticus TaxID=1131652 RepID=A0AAD4KJB3_9EURO|nr:uncharacterized protein BGW36DRAFT_466456 [Talaromyces proteolyticus]KAH8689603.1 hypothetical protein BGW36DRAFT_466456 [Talaromyces proteolyticus]